MKIRDIVQSVFETIGCLIGAVTFVTMAVASIGGWEETLFVVAIIAVMVFISWIAMIIRRANKG